MNETRNFDTRRLAVESLKCCPVCGAINAFDKVQCFVCSWHGAFDHEPQRIEDALANLLGHCPDLEDVVLDEPASRPHRKERVRAFLKRLFWPAN